MDDDDDNDADADDDDNNNDGTPARLLDRCAAAVRIYLCSISFIII